MILAYLFFVWILIMNMLCSCLVCPGLGRSVAFNMVFSTHICHTCFLFVYYGILYMGELCLFIFVLSIAYIHSRLPVCFLFTRKINVVLVLSLLMDMAVWSNIVVITSMGVMCD
jgi:hypothetical protein